MFKPICFAAVLFADGGMGATTATGTECPQAPRILCGVLSDDKLGAKFDKLVQSYFAANELGTSYLDDLTKHTALRLLRPWMMW